MADNAAEKTINGPELQRLATSRKASDSRAAEERGAWGAKFKAAQEKFGVDPIAFAFAYRLWKMADVGRSSRILRNFQHYADLLEIGGQEDIEDAIAAKTDTEEDAGVVDDIIGETGGGANLTTFRTAMEAAVDAAAVNKGLERFVGDRPDLATEATAIARERITKIDAANGGGEDLRPQALRDRAGNDATQIAAEAKGHSVKSNAVRAARKAGVDEPFVFKATDELWYWRKNPPAESAAGAEKRPN